MSIELKPIDRKTYQEKIRDFLPARLIDIHTHIWRKSFAVAGQEAGSPAAWADRVAPENALDDLARDYRQMLPRQEVIPLLFGYPSRAVDPQANNAWVREVSRVSRYPALFLSTPDMPALVLEAEVRLGRFRGLKPYPDFAPPALDAKDVSIFDFLPRAHLEVADANRWIVMLHIPRPGRLSDPLNLKQLVEIEKAFPNLRLIVAHLGRAYCPEDLGDALDVLRRTGRLYFDLSANTCSHVMEKMLQAVGNRRILFGSDMPITRMRMGRVCEAGGYVNLVPRGMYGDVSADAHMREVDKAEAGNLTFFLYEEILAFRRAAEALNLSSAQIEDVFFGNAHRLLFENGE